MTSKGEIVDKRDEKQSCAELDALLEWVREQRAKPWAESGSFASRMTGEEGYDAALEEFEAKIEALR